jgi:L-ascorbate metabolism protein UlaG (beta-lactamase superfamily)
MQITLIRNATLLLEIGGRRVLVDRALDEPGARPPVQNTADQRRNPLVPLPFPAEHVLRDLDGVLVTHLHRDHFDETGERLLPRTLPVFCQPSDRDRLLAAGLDVRPVYDELNWDGMRIARTGGRHSLDPKVEGDLGPVSGFVFDQLYLTSDSVWCAEVATAIRRWRPAVAVVNAGAARFLNSGPISMTSEDVFQVAARVPTVIAVHLEAMNHCSLTRTRLRGVLPGVLVPEDGETLLV